MSDKWMNDMRNLLGEHETDVPEELLDDIRQEMLRRQLRVSVPPARRAALVPRWYRGVAAAAAVVLLAGGGLWWRQHHGEALVTADSSSAPVAQVEKVAAQVPSATAGSVAVQQLLAAHTPRVASAKATAKAAHSAEMDMGMAAVAMAEAPSTTPEEGEKTTMHSDEAAPKRPARPSDDELLRMLGGSLVDPIIDSEAAPRLTAGIYYGSMAAGTPAASDNAAYFADGYSGFYHFKPSPVSRIPSPLGIATDPHSAAEHHQPVRLGVQVSYRVADRWALRTGLTYSYLSSVFTSANYPIRTDATQKLHYVGIPVGVSYQLWGNRRLQVYATAGGEIEKLVDGRVATAALDDIPAVKEKVTERRPQFSVNAALGAAYHFTDWMSIYLEPGVSHYFDNHSTVQNYYKDKPTGFNLNMGLRIDVNK